VSIGKRYENFSTKAGDVQGGIPLRFDWHANPQCGVNKRGRTQDDAVITGNGGSMEAFEPTGTDNPRSHRIVVLP
jgi:hypothetical protein